MLERTLHATQSEGYKPFMFTLCACTKAHDAVGLCWIMVVGAAWLYCELARLRSFATTNKCFAAVHSCEAEGCDRCLRMTARDMWKSLVNITCRNVTPP